MGLLACLLVGRREQHSEGELRYRGLLYVWLCLCTRLCLCLCLCQHVRAGSREEKGAVGLLPSITPARPTRCAREKGGKRESMIHGAETDGWTGGRPAEWDAVIIILCHFVNAAVPNQGIDQLAWRKRASVYPSIHPIPFVN